MFFHNHPYPPFIPNTTTKLIVGTLPPPRFSVGQLLEKDVDFCYGSYYNSLWLYIDKIHNLNLRYDNSDEAIQQRKQFLIMNGIGVCDIVHSAERDKIDASDLGMKNIQLRDVVGYLIKHPSIETLLFTGGNSKNGPEYFFRKHLKDYGLKLEEVSNEVPRIHQFKLPVRSSAVIERRSLSGVEVSRNAVDNLDVRSSGVETSNSISENNLAVGSSGVETSPRIIKTVSLTSASGSANRAIGSMPLYQQLKTANPNFTTFDFRVMQYREFF